MCLLLNVIFERGRAKQLNGDTRRNSLTLLYQIGQTFFDLLIDSATHRRVSANMLKAVELRLQRRRMGTLSAYCNYNVNVWL